MFSSSTKAYVDRFLSVLDQNEKNLMQFLESSSVDEEYNELIDEYRRQSIMESTNLSELDRIENRYIEVESLSSSSDEYDERIDHENQRLNNNIHRNRPMTMDCSTQTEDTMATISDNHCEMISSELEKMKSKFDNFSQQIQSMSNVFNHHRQQSPYHQDQQTSVSTNVASTSSGDSSINNDNVNMMDDWKFSCTKCRFKFETKATFSRHLRSHRPGQKYLCEKCGNLYKSRSILRKHYQLHSNLEPFKCHKCNDKFKRRDYLYQHMRRKHS
ncbi:uncharacterized protein LOC124493364 [Dermatophagoides farinae]|uniref:uncharacterized protein LOC124493364 n=1 Tax=Dermatophagoides farinae TaxID=6954 RepID=UPI003F5DCD61